jgi:hypothetical protein
MTQDPTFLATVKGAVPEHFVFVTVYSDFSGIKHTLFLRGETELREFCRFNGRPGLTEAEIDAMIEEARTKQI